MQNPNAAVNIYGTHKKTNFKIAFVRYYEMPRNTKICNKNSDIYAQIGRQCGMLHLNLQRLLLKKRHKQKKVH